MSTRMSSTWFRVMGGFGKISAALPLRAHARQRAGMGFQGRIKTSFARDAAEKLSVGVYSQRHHIRV